jgi:hypothetical protein
MPQQRLEDVTTSDTGADNAPYDCKQRGLAVIRGKGWGDVGVIKKHLDYMDLAEIGGDIEGGLPQIIFVVRRTSFG